MNILDLDDPTTWRTPKDHEVVRLARLQDGICALCGKPLFRRTSKAGSNRTSLDHVWPKNRDHTHGRDAPPGCGKWEPKRPAGARRRIRWNKLAAHGKCNSAKGNRYPTGCELIWLAAIRARLGEPDPGPARGAIEWARGLAA